MNRREEEDQRLANHKPEPIQVARRKKRLNELAIALGHGEGGDRS